MNDNSRITSEHLSRAAWVYVRQSTPGQVQNHPESRQRKYRLMERAGTGVAADRDRRRRPWPFRGRRGAARI